MKKILSILLATLMIFGAFAAVTAFATEVEEETVEAVTKPLTEEELSSFVDAGVIDEEEALSIIEENQTAESETNADEDTENELLSQSEIAPAPSDEAETEEGVSVFTAGTAFIAITLGSKYKDTQFALIANDKILATCVADVAGTVKFTLPSDYDVFVIDKAGVLYSDVNLKDFERQPDDRILEFFLGEDFAGKKFYFSEPGEAEPTEVTLDKNGCIVVEGGESHKYYFVYSNLLEPDEEGFTEKVATIEEIESMASAEKEYTGKQPKTNNNILPTIIFVIVVVGGIGYLVYDKVIKNRKNANKENNDDIGDDDEDDE